MRRVDEDELAGLVAAAMPQVDDPTPAEMDSVWSRVAPGLTSSPVRRRRLRVVMGAGLAAVVVGTGGVAAADYFSAHTGHGPSDAEDLELGGPGERLDPAGADFRTVLDEETRDIAFPSDAVRQRVLGLWVDDQTRDHPRPGETGVSTGALRGWIAENAVCSWADEWARALRAGNRTAEEAAADQLTGAQEWPAITALDPEQRRSPITVYGTDGKTGETLDWAPVEDRSMFYYLTLLPEAVDQHDLSRVAWLLRRDAFCVPVGMSNLPRALPGTGRRGHVSSGH